MKLCIAIVAGAILLGGCATFSSLPSEARVISRAAVSSARVGVDKPRLKYSDGVYLLSGLVHRRFSQQSTAGSYLEVAFYNAAGDKLRNERVDFTPAELLTQLGRHIRYGSYELVLDAMPPGTVHIEVRAYDTGPPTGR